MNTALERCHAEAYEGPAAMRCVKSPVGVAPALVSDVIRFMMAIFRSPTSLVAEKLFLRKQLARTQSEAATAD